MGWRRAPDVVENLPGMAFSRETPGTEITKITTWLEAPATGDVFFWISSRGAAKLIVSQPDSIHPLATGGLLFIKDSIGWPAVGQWDLYPEQRLGPLPVEKGKRYLVEIWHGGQTGLKRCEVSWSYSDGGPVKDFAPEATMVQGRRTAAGTFEALKAKAPSPAEEEGKAGGEDPPAGLFPAEQLQWFAAAGDGAAWQFKDSPLIQRITLYQVLQTTQANRQPEVGLHLIVRDLAGSVRAETKFKPEGYPMTGRLEWELPEPTRVSSLEVTLEIDGKSYDASSAPLPYAFEAWGPEALDSRSVARAELKGNMLAATKAGPGDADGNGLNDNWEAGRRLAPSGPEILTSAADEDGDGLLNQMESLAERDPFSPDLLGYRFTADYWFNVPRSDVAGLVSSDAFYKAPSLRVVRWMDRASPLPPNTGVRLRGYFTPSESGPHQFWIAARNAGELWISEDATKFRKYKIASLSPSEGSGHGISRDQQDQWDKFASQVSRPILLEAGKTYFMEALAQQGAAVNHSGQLRLAFSSSSTSRRSLDSRLIQTFIPVAEDKDDDYLPDDWERASKLDPLDNGLTDRARQGERGDFDADGLSNLLEFQLGTDPANPDTDSDGKTDGEEYHQLGTSPVSSDGSKTMDTLKLDPASYTFSTQPWLSLPDPVTGQNVLRSSHFRGEIEWTFDVKEPGYYGYRFKFSLSGQTLATETLPLILSVDQSRVARESVSFALGKTSEWTVAGPWLEAGRHNVRVLVDNALIRRSLAIHEITVFQPEGPDFDRDGLVDWYLAALNRGYSLRAPSPVSVVSPVCLEGTAPGVVDAIQVNGGPVRAIGDQQWYTNVPLDHGPNVISLQLPGRPERTVPITWQSTNVLEDATIHLRTGDSLLLASVNLSGENIVATCTTNTGDRFGVVTGTTWRFDEPGTTTITGRAAGLRGTLTIHVAAASLPEEIFVIENLMRRLPVPSGSLSPGIALEGSPGLSASWQPDVLTLLPSHPGNLGLTARIAPGGPILAASRVSALRVVEALMQDSTQSFSTGAPAGYFRLRAPLYVAGLPEGATVEVKIFRAGVMFADGTVTATLTVADFQDGLAWLEFFFPLGLDGGYCHYITIRDRDCVIIGRK